MNLRSENREEAWNKLAKLYAREEIPQKFYSRITQPQRTKKRIKLLKPTVDARLYRSNLLVMVRYWAEVTHSS